MSQVICKICGKEYRVTPSVAKYTKYCSKDCHNKSKLGKKLSDATKKKISEKFQGELHPNYKGGRYLGSDGYFMIISLDHPNRDKHHYVREHRLVAEKCLERYLTRVEVIHHINEVKTDNNPENLYLFASEKEHNKHHNLGNPKLVSNLI